IYQYLSEIREKSKKLTECGAREQILCLHRTRSTKRNRHTEKRSQKKQQVFSHTCGNMHVIVGKSAAEKTVQICHYFNIPTSAWREGTGNIPVNTGRVST
ncbi:hypothetical protein M5D96_013713, partial [Drosophila gunungcola]